MSTEKTSKVETEIISKIDRLQSKINLNKNAIKNLQAEIYKNKNLYGVLFLDCQRLIRVLKDYYNNKHKLNTLYRKENKFTRV